MPKHTVIVPVQFAVAVACEYADDGTLLATESSFHAVQAGTPDAERPGEEDAWDACLEVPPTKKNGQACDAWPDYLERARQRLAMELGRPIFWEEED